MDSFLHQLRLTTEDRDRFAVLNRADDRYSRYNFHSMEALDDLEAWSRYGEDCTLLLLGDEGIGRTYLLDTLAYNARQKDRRYIVLHVDLDGYEPNQRIATFIRYRGLNLDGIAPQDLSPAAKDSMSVWEALLIVLIQAESGLKTIYKELATNDPSWTSLHPRKKCNSLLKAASKRSAIIMHFVAGATIPHLLLSGLLEDRRHLTNTFLAISCDAEESVTIKRQIINYKEIQVGRLESQSIKTVLDRNFAPNDFPLSFHEALLEASEGLPCFAAMYMLDFVSRDAIRRDGSGSWCVADPGICGNTISSSPNVTQETYYQCCSNDDSTAILQNFLSLAELCGSVVPGALLVQYLELNIDAANTLVESIDTTMVGTDSIFLDLEYCHPGFPRQFTYRFSSTAAHFFVMKHNGNDQQARAKSFLQFARERECRKTRAIYQLLYYLAKNLSFTDDAEAFRHVLLCWVSDFDVTDCLNCLQDAFSCHHLSPESVFDACRELWEVWSSSQQEAMLDVCFRVRREMSDHAQGEIHYLRAIQFRHRGELEASSGETGLAIKCLSAAPVRNCPLLARCHALTGLNYLSGWDHERARKCLDRALAELRVKPDSELLEVMILHEFAVHTGEGAGAGALRKFLLEQALSAQSRFASKAAERVLDLFRCLSDGFRTAGEMDESVRCLKCALGYAEALYGDDSADVAVLLKLIADVLEKDQRATARSCLERVLQIELRRGTDLQAASVTHKRLADLAESLNDLKAARSHLQHALMIDESLDGTSNPNLIVLCKLLTDVSMRLGDIQSADQYSRRVLHLTDSSRTKSLLGRNSIPEQLASS